MLNTLTHCRFDPVPEVLTTAAGLREKVDDQGDLLPFPGNTVVFTLDAETKQKLTALQAALYAQCGDLLARQLHPDTFHMTLHDLANGSCLCQKDEMALRAKVILDELRAQPSTPIPMRAVCTFNMVDTSVVLLLEPENGEAWQRLDALYLRFQEVRELPYALTPHITLAYYRPGCYCAEQTRRLRQALGAAALDVQLEIKELVLQDFDHMNAYKTLY